MPETEAMTEKWEAAARKHSADWLEMIGVEDPEIEEQEEGK